MPDLKLELRARSGDKLPAENAAFAPVRTSIMMLILGGVWVISLTSLSLQIPELDFFKHSSFIRQVGYIFLAVLAALTIGTRDLRRKATLPGPIVAVLAWSAFSLTWSDQLELSISRLTLTALITWLMFTSVSYIGSGVSFRITKIIFLIYLSISLFAIFLVPQIATDMESHGQWRGLLGDKNQAGAIAAITALLWLFSGPYRERVPGLLVAIAASLFLWKTNSRTAEIMLFSSAIVGSALMYRPYIGVGRLSAFRRFDQVWIGICAVIVLTVLYLTFTDNTLLSLISDPKMLSRRGEIWQAMVRTYQQNVWLGTGFGGYWKQEAVRDYGGSWHRGVTHGHSGFLDLALQIGLPGLLLTLIAIVFLPVRDIASLARADYRIAAAPAALFVFTIGSNLTESALFERDRVWWLALLLALASLKTDLRASKSTRRVALPDRRRTSLSGDFR